MNTDASSIKTFYIDASLAVYDFLNPVKRLFTLSSKYKPFLNNSAPNTLLINAFQQNDYRLNPQAVIARLIAWKIINSPDAPVNRPVIYEWIAIVLEKDSLFHIYGSTLLWLKNIPAIHLPMWHLGRPRPAKRPSMRKPFTPMVNRTVKFIAGIYTWEQMMTCPKAQL